MTQISIEPNVFWALVTVGGFAFVLLPLLLTSGPTRNAIQSLRDKLGLSSLSWWLFLLASAAWMLILALLLIGLAHTIWEIIWQIVPQTKTNQTQSQIWEFRFSIARLAGLTATIGAIIALPFTLIRLRLSHQQNETATEALFNDKLNAATEDLHAMRQRWDGEQNIWEDDITRRNAAIDRLEGLANERPDIAPRISRQLSVYVREMSRENPAEEFPSETSSKELRKWLGRLKVKRSDMETAVQVLGRLRQIEGIDPVHVTIDLRGANLQGFNLEGLQFDEANFFQAKMQKATLDKANLRKANFSQAELQRTHFGNTNMQKANLSGAELQKAFLKEADLRGANLCTADMQGAFLTKAILTGADLNYAELERAKLTQAKLQWANLSEASLRNANLSEVDLQGADLRGAEMQGATLNKAKLQEANLIGATFDRADLRWVELDEFTKVGGMSFSGALLNSVDFSESKVALSKIQGGFGDATTCLPYSIRPEDPSWPQHWPSHRLDGFEAKAEWEEWLKDPENYKPPASPKS